MSGSPLRRAPHLGRALPAVLSVLTLGAMVIPVLGLTGCTAHSVSAMRPVSASPTAAPTTAPPPPPTVQPTTPPPLPPPPPGTLPVATGSGPAGSMRVTGGQDVALTFDDGPDPTYTPKILDLLKQNGVKATFCLVGKQAKANPDLVRRIVAEGHTVCDHTWAHSLTLGKQPTEVMLKDMQDTNDAIHAAVPDYKIKYFRAPGGNFTPALVAAAAQLGMKSLYWAVDARDWEYSKWGHGSSMVSHIISTVESKVRRGSIVLSHDFQKPDTINAYKTLLPWLKAHVTLVAMPVT